MEVDEGSDQVSHLAPLDAVHVSLKNASTEDEKYHNLMRWLKWLHTVHFSLFFLIFPILFKHFRSCYLSELRHEKNWLVSNRPAELQESVAVLEFWLFATIESV